MASKGKRDLSGYNYSAIASLVITDRSQVPRRDKEPDGAPESLVGRINPKDMGSRCFVKHQRTWRKKGKKYRRPEKSLKRSEIRQVLDIPISLKQRRTLRA